MTDPTSQQLATRVLNLYKTRSPGTWPLSMAKAAPDLAREVLRIPELEHERDEALEKVKTFKRAVEVQAEFILRIQDPRNTQ